MNKSNPISLSFETIRNNTALKLKISFANRFKSFETIRNNTALKRFDYATQQHPCFETIRNNTALKLLVNYRVLDEMF